MNLGGIFSVKILVSVLIGLILYDMFVKNMINKYDDTLDSYDEPTNKKDLQKFLKEYHNQKGRNYKLPA